MLGAITTLLDKTYRARNAFVACGTWRRKQHRRTYSPYRAMASNSSKRKVGNQASICLTSQENEEIFRIIGEGCLSLATAVVQLLLSSPPDYSTWYSACYGVACFIKDNNRKAYYIQVISLPWQDVIWEQEMYRQFKYVPKLPIFHCFEGDECQVGLNFADKVEAESFKTAVQEKLDLRDKRRQERQSVRHPRPKIEVTQVGLNVPAKMEITLTTSTEKLSKKDAKKQKKQEVKTEKKSKKKAKLNKTEIGTPTDFKHLKHVGFEKNTAPVTSQDVSILNLPENRALLAEAGITPDILQNNEALRLYAIQQLQKSTGGVQTNNPRKSTRRKADREVRPSHTQSRPLPSPPRSPVPNRSRPPAARQPVANPIPKPPHHQPPPPPSPSPHPNSHRRGPYARPPAEDYLPAPPPDYHDRPPTTPPPPPPPDYHDRPPPTPPPPPPPPGPHGQPPPGPRGGPPPSSAPPPPPPPSSAPPPPPPPPPLGLQARPTAVPVPPPPPPPPPSGIQGRSAGIPPPPPPMPNAGMMGMPPPPAELMFQSRANQGERSHQLPEAEGGRGAMLRQIRDGSHVLRKAAPVQEEQLPESEDSRDAMLRQIRQGGHTLRKVVRQERPALVVPSSDPKSLDLFSALNRVIEGRGRGIHSSDESHDDSDSYGSDDDDEWEA